MGLINEPTLQFAYLILGLFLSAYVFIKAKKRVSFYIIGITLLTLVVSDALYIIPSIFNVEFSLHYIDIISYFDIGSTVTSILGTVILVLSYWFGKILLKKETPFILDITVVSLATIRIIFSLFPAYDWSYNISFIWTIIKSIPLILLGLVLAIVALKWFREDKEKLRKYAFVCALIATTMMVEFTITNKVSPILIGVTLTFALVYSIWLLSFRSIKKLE